MWETFTSVKIVKPKYQISINYKCLDLIFNNLCSKQTAFQNKLWYFLECVLLNNNMIFIKETIFK